MKITSIISNWQWLDGGAMFGHVPRVLWERWCSPDSEGRIELACRCFLLEHEGKKYLLETGIGCYMEPRTAARYGVKFENNLLLEKLESLGIQPHDIDAVILSHLHFDHAGGLLDSFTEISKHGPKLMFPRAKFFVGRVAFDRATNPHFRDRASFIPKLDEMLIESGRLVLIDEKSDEKVFENCEFIFTNGHTPGQMHCLFKGDDRKYFFAGDLVPGLPWLHLPVCMGYDRCAETLVDEKEELLEKASREGWAILYTHDLEFACSGVRKDEKGRYVAHDLIKDFTRKNI